VWRVVVLIGLVACERAEDSKPNPEPIVPPAPVEPKPVAKGFIGVKYVVDNFRAGARVDMVIPDMPAEGAGVQPGDMIVRFNGKPVTGADLVDHVQAAPVGRVAQLVVERDGQELTLLLPIRERPESELTARDEPARRLLP
jgi:S1-C subfamily serine protease